jgi:hypothetical protein
MSEHWDEAEMLLAYFVIHARKAPFLRPADLPIKASRRTMLTTTADCARADYAAETADPATAGPGGHGLQRPQREAKWEPTNVDLGGPLLHGGRPLPGNPLSAIPLRPAPPPPLVFAGATGRSMRPADHIQPRAIKPSRRTMRTTPATSARTDCVGHIGTVVPEWQWMLGCRRSGGPGYAHLCKSTCSLNARPVDSEHARACSTASRSRS